MIGLVDQVDVQPPGFAGRFERVGNQVEHHLLDLRSVDLQRTRSAGVEGDRAIAEPAHVPHQGKYLVDQFDQVVGSPGGILASREVQQPGGDLLAPERLATDHLGVLPDHRLLVRCGLPQQCLKPFLQALAGHRNCRQRIVDLVSHTRGQEPHAGESFRTDQLTRAITNLSVQVVSNITEPVGHLVERFGQFGHLVPCGQLDAVVQVSLRHPTCPFVQRPDRLEDPAVSGMDKSDKQQCRSNGRPNQPSSP